MNACVSTLNGRPHGHLPIVTRTTDDTSFCLYRNALIVPVRIVNIIVHVSRVVINRDKTQYGYKAHNRIFIAVALRMRIKHGVQIHVGITHMFSFVDSWDPSKTRFTGFIIIMTYF